MLPTAFVFLDALPLTLNGKVDRKKLPAPGASSGLAGPAYSPPRDAIEEMVAEIWAEVLGLEKVGIHSNFFELGGHSLLALQVISRLSEAFLVEISVRSLFDSPTVAGVTRSLTQVQIEAQDEDALELLSLVEHISEDDLKMEFGRRLPRKAPFLTQS
jgi:acyl carrier protein